MRPTNYYFNRYLSQKRLNRSRPSLGGFSSLLPFALLGVLLFVSKPLLDTIKNLFESTRNITGGVNNLISDYTGTSQSAVKVSDNVVNPGSPFSYTLWKTTPHAFLIKQSLVDKMCMDIWDSVGFFSVDFGKIISTFKLCQYQTQISWLAYNFHEKYKEDLLSYFSDTSLLNSVLRVHLSSFQTAQIVDYCNKLKLTGM